MKRKHIPNKTLRAALLVQLGDIPYEHAKLMTEDQIISLYEVDHCILYESGHPDRDKFWNLTHLLIRAHREKTKQDAGIIGKGRRIRNKFPPLAPLVAEGQPLLEPSEIADSAVRWAKRKIRSRGFDKTRRRKWDGTVVLR
jgi:hypothetical protein